MNVDILKFTVEKFGDFTLSRQYKNCIGNITMDDINFINDDTFTTQIDVDIFKPIYKPLFYFGGGTIQLTVKKNEFVNLEIFFPDVEGHFIYDYKWEDRSIMWIDIDFEIDRFIRWWKRDRKNE